MKISLRLCHWAALAPIVIWSVGLGFAADQTDAVDDYIGAEMAKQHVPGLALLVSRGGKVIRAQGWHGER